MEINKLTTSNSHLPHLILIAKIYRILALRRRAGTAHSKVRSEVHATTKKLYRQKGSGRARVGSRGSPIRRGGGVSFGPRTKNFKLVYNYNKKEHWKALSSCLKYYASNDRLFTYSGVSEKTKDNVKFLNEFRILNNVTGKILMVGEDDDLNIGLNNIKHVHIIQYKSLNLYDCVNQQVILINNNKLQEINKYLI